MNLEEIVNDKYDLLTANDREMLTSIFHDKQAIKEMFASTAVLWTFIAVTLIVTGEE